MERPERRDAGEEHPPGGENEAIVEPIEESASEEPETTPSPEPLADSDTVEVRIGDDEEESFETESRMRFRENHIRELYDEISAVRLSADEARARQEAAERRMADLEGERARLKERIRTLEEEGYGRRRRREGSERQIQRLEREIDRLRGEISRRDHLLEQRDDELDAFNMDASDIVTRKDQALEDALRRVEGLERDLEDRENVAADLRDTIDALRAEIEDEHELRRRLAEPANRLRAGIDLFNESAQLRQVHSLSRTLGQPEVHVSLDTGDEPAAILGFTWQGITWQTYAANPGLAVEEPRVYLASTGEDLSGVDRKPPNARIGPGGRVLLGL